MSQVEMTDIEHAVDIMDISMLPSTMMNIVFGHRYFGTVENSGLNSKSGRISSKKKGPTLFLPHSYRSRCERHSCSWSKSIVPRFPRF